MNVLRIIVFVVGIKAMQGVKTYCECVSKNPSVDSFSEAQESCPRHADFMTAVITLFCKHLE
jgi:hypothetical protein